jgi:hypothetical protein
MTGYKAPHMANNRILVFYCEKAVIQSKKTSIEGKLTRYFSQGVFASRSIMTPLQMASDRYCQTLSRSRFWYADFVLQNGRRTEAPIPLKLSCLVL